MSDMSHQRDTNQIWALAWDEANQVLRTSATIDVSGGIEVLINHLEDSISLGDGEGSNRLAYVNEDNELLVHDEAVLDALGEVKTEVEHVGNELEKLSSGLITEPFDEIQVATRDGDGNPTVLNFKLATVTQATLTLSYDGDGYLSGIVKS